MSRRSSARASRQQRPVVPSDDADATTRIDNVWSLLGVIITNTANLLRFAALLLVVVTVLIGALAVLHQIDPQIFSLLPKALSAILAGWGLAEGGRMTMRYRYSVRRSSAVSQHENRATGSSFGHLALAH